MVFPYSKNFVPAIPKCAADTIVAAAIVVYFLQPECAVITGCSPSAMGATMPETPINEHYNPRVWKVEVWAAYYAGVVLNPAP